MSEREPANRDAIPASWADGAAYERYIGRWSRPVAHEFLAWLAVEPDGTWLDVGCGTGALVETILRDAVPRSVLGIDRSAGFIGLAREQVDDARASFAVGDATALEVEDDAFDAVVSGLVLNFVPEPAAMAAEMLRTARPGGVVGAYVWDYAGRMDLIRTFWDAARTIDPGAAAVDQGERFPLCAPGPLHALFSDAGAGEVATRAIDIPTRFVDFDDYWLPFLGGQGPAPTYAASLPTETLATIRDEARRRLPVAPDGSIDLIARAWAVSGRRPT